MEVLGAVGCGKGWVAPSLRRPGGVGGFGGGVLGCFRGQWGRALCPACCPAAWCFLRALATMGSSKGEEEQGVILISDDEAESTLGTSVLLVDPSGRHWAPAHL